MADPELDKVRSALRKKLGNISDRHLNRLIKQREMETLLPRRLAIFSLANDNSVSIRATPEELAELRASRLGQSAPAPQPARVIPATQPRSTRARTGTATKAAPAPKPTKARKVCIVYGRNTRMRQQLAIFLRALDLDVMEWNRLLGWSGKGTPSIYEDVLTTAFREAAAVVVLLTPDDEVMLFKQFWKSSDEAYEHARVGQARANVLFEAGMAFGRNPTSTVLVQVGTVKPFSDTRGLHITHLTNHPDSRRELATKLTTAGCAVNDTGTDWLHDGDFNLA